LPSPIWVKQGINAWMIAAGIEDGPLLRSVQEREGQSRHPERMGGLVGS
jgi:hypothetical protein